MKMSNKSSIPQLDLESASRILEQAFEANQMESSTIPLDVLVSYANYRRERFTLQRTLIAVITALLLLLPLLFVPSSFVVEEGQSKNLFHPVYSIAVDTFMPVERVSASIDGSNIPVYETDLHTLVSRQTRTEYVDVTTVDREHPVVTSCTRHGDQIHLYLSDFGSGVDFSSIQAMDPNGTIIDPDSVDPATGCIIFSGPLRMAASDFPS